MPEVTDTAASPKSLLFLLFSVGSSDEGNVRGDQFTSSHNISVIRGSSHCLCHPSRSVMYGLANLWSAKNGSYWTGLLLS